MKNYELMFIVKSTLDDASLKKEVADVKSLVADNKGKVNDFKELGRKKLAYEINKEVSGFYYLMHFTITSESVKEVDRKLRINENIIRHLILNMEEK